MRFSSPEEWQDVFGFNPGDLSPEGARRQITAQIREMCNDLNQRADRRDIARGLKRLARAGKLLEDHRWLQGEL